MSKLYQAILEIINEIPSGKVMTCNEIARICGNKKARHFVSRSFTSFPEFLRAPCHRVILSNGKVIKKFAYGGMKMQIKALQSEGIKVQKGIVVNHKQLKFLPSIEYQKRIKEKYDLINQQDANDNFESLSGVESNEKQENEKQEKNNEENEKQKNQNYQQEIPNGHKNLNLNNQIAESRQDKQDDQDQKNHHMIEESSIS